ncbi:hypothetical protein ARC20_12600 [Stenotrophomonas panacihumi]|uniref:Uncharacterized protein n=1 Tax=Stenotrophomonas panacihumi TaxID=676599 RepID=A0A0R0AJA6_9GAMM|nr:hypothetical protein [Stenotrophomonas panacihumi]KRG40659.1 hypothetical protein ARC20_12600 [Stenotrophomonas panacihumi]
MAPDISVSPHSTAQSEATALRGPSAARRHWLCRDLVLHTIDALGHSRLSPSVIDLERELSFWRGHYQRTAAWHRDVLPFAEYVPAFTLGIGLFLQCHDCLLEALNERMISLRYARVRRRSRVEWHEARQAVHAAYLRLQAHWETVPARHAHADAMPEPTGLHAAVRGTSASLLPPRAKRARARPA